MRLSVFPKPLSVFSITRVRDTRRCSGANGASPRVRDTNYHCATRDFCFFISFWWKRDFLAKKRKGVCFLRRKNMQDANSLSQSSTSFFVDYVEENRRCLSVHSWIDTRIWFCHNAIRLDASQSERGGEKREDATTARRVWVLFLFCFF